MKKLTLTKTESKLIKEFIGGLTIEKNIYRKCLEFIVLVKKEYVDSEYIVCSLFNTNGEIKGMARTKEGKSKEYKTTRGLINFLNKEYNCDLDKECIEKLLLEVSVQEDIEEVQKGGKMMAKKEIKINNITETTFEDSTYWIEYKVGDKYGYDITTEFKEGEEKIIEDIYNTDLEINKKAIEKIDINTCSSYLKEIIEECRQSENEMWFVEFGEINEDLSACEDEVDQFILRLKEEVDRLGISEHIIFYEDDIVITVFGGVITQFLF